MIPRYSDNFRLTRPGICVFPSHLLLFHTLSKELMRPDIVIMGFFAHYKALLYKNWVLWKRNIGMSLCEFLCPLFFIIIIVIIREAIKASSHSADTFVDRARYVNPLLIPGTSFETATMTYENANIGWNDVTEGYDASFSEFEKMYEAGGWTFALVPDNSDFVDKVGNALLQQHFLSNMRVLKFATESEFEDYVTSSNYGDSDKPRICFGVVFQTIGPQYTYSIRFNNTANDPTSTDRVGDFVDVFNTDQLDDVDAVTGTPTRYQSHFIEYGFFSIQSIVDTLILREVTQDEDAYIVPGFIPMYFNDYVDDSFQQVIAQTLPLFIIISYIVPVSRMISNVVSEKETRIKEVMMMMGMTNSAYWASWVTYYFCFYSVLAGVITLITQPKVFEFSHGGFIFLYFWLFGISCIAYCFLIQTFFSRARTAFLFGAMMFLVMYFISFSVDERTNTGNSKSSASLLPPVALVLGANNLGNLERQRVGVTSSSVNDTIEHYQFSTCLIMMVIDTIIFTVLGLYFEQVWPNDVGTKKPWYFPVTCCCRKKVNPAEVIEKKVKWGNDVEDVDLALEQQKDSDRAMMVRHLTKKFNKKVAVDDLNLDIYEGQIFALLGHNGAGKTTTISMLTGLITATTGEMTVHGKLLSNDLNDIRKELGVCPQHNVLFNDLTVSEHLYVFSVFKGQTNKKLIKEKADEIIEAVDMKSQMNVRADRLSGGQKRKLSLALALIGESPIVFLDEPTAGMDITARRQMWDMLKNNKAGRIILLTTHYMEEADILADRIAIISDGQLRCCGSSLYLKSRFGVGYYLNLVKEAGLMSSEHSKRVVQFVQGHVPSAVVMNDIPGEISFQMPTSEVNRFKDMFTELDSRLKQLGLHSYGISVTTLEEVFLKVAQGSHTASQPLTSGEVIQEVSAPAENKGMVDHQGVDFYLAKDRVQGSLICRHMQALLRKRFLTNVRDYKSIICEILVPIVLVLLGLGLLMIGSWFDDQNGYDLNIEDHYSTPQSVLYASAVGVTVDPQISTYFGTSDVAVGSAQGNMDLNAFDLTIFNQRDHDPYRMGSFYFYKSDELAHQFEVVVFHNQTAYQSSPTYLSVISQAIIRSYNPQVTIKVENHPLPITYDVKTINGGRTGFISSIVFSLGFAFIPVGIISFIVAEREMNVKHQQLVSGVSIPAYWVTNYIWDFTKHFIPAVICALFVLAFQIDSFTNPSDSYGVLWLLMVLYGFSVSTFSYFTSFFFKTSSMSQSITLLIHFIAGSILPSVIFVLYLFDSSRDAAHALMWIFRFIPNFCFGMGLMNLGNRDNFAFLDGEKDGYEPFDIKSAGGDLLMLGLTAIFYMVLLFVMEWLEVSPSVRKCLKGSLPSDLSNAFMPDEDVETEKQKAAAMNPTEAQVILRNIRQVYRHLFSKPVLGVDEVSVTVDYKECFALLGVNGAGKTSTFRIMTGEYAPTAGEAFIGGYSVTSEMSKVRKIIGYCPQFDALSEYLTGREILEMYADLKGIPRSKRTELVNEMLNEMDLTQYANVKCGTYSGGNKRKLSVAMALLGNPSVVFLDEPSAGMDPEARKKMWKVIGSIKKRNSAVVLTTHSMEEAETLCDRIAIMVAGRLRCLGTATRIKNKFGSGYELEIKVVIPTEADIAAYLQKIRFGGNLKIEQVRVALTELGHPEYEAEISQKGRGAAIHAQMQLDKFIPATTLVAWVLTEEVGDNIYRFLSEQFASVTVIEHYLSFFKYKIERQEDRTLGFLFSCVETNKDRLKVSEYSVTQTSLEQIFNQFARLGGTVESD